MAPAPPAYVDTDYWRLGWHAARQRLRAVLAALVAAAPGVAFGLWLARDAQSDYFAVLVATVCGLGTAAVVAGLRRTLGGRPVRAAARLVRCRYRGELAVIPPPPTALDTEIRGTAIAQQALLASTGAGLGAVLATSVAAAAARPLAVAAIAATTLLTAVFGPAPWLRGPAVAMYADRLEVRRRLGRYVVAWQDVFKAEHRAGKRRDTVEVTVTTPTAVTPRGWVRRPTAREVRFAVAGGSAAAVVRAIEYHRQQPPQQRRVSIVLSARPRVVDDGRP